MLFIEVSSWIVLGVLAGTSMPYLSTTRVLSTPEAMTVGVLGAVLGGLAGIQLSGELPGTYRGFGLVAALFGALLLLLIDWSYRGWRGPARRGT